jgi:hypothetical protein
MSRFALLGLALFWTCVAFAMSGRPAFKVALTCFWYSIPFGIVFGIPLVNLAERLELRRYCKSRGFRILKHQWRGVIYMDGDQKRYSRWPEDFTAPVP